MKPDIWSLYRQMLFSRLFELAVQELWDEGLISGEMHLGTGEEAIITGVMAHVEDGDALALDHRGTAAMLMHGIKPLPLLQELLGQSVGLCGGMGGHMHLFSREHLAASSGIVGASGPGAVGFALAGTMLRPGSVAVAFFGEGAMNEGMLMESLNLAVTWRLPVLFVCKDNNWSIFTDSEKVRGGDLVARAASFGMPSESVDGREITAVYQAAIPMFERARNGQGPSFLHATCVHLEGHFLGDPLVKMGRQPLSMSGTAVPMMKSLASRGGGSRQSRLESTKAVMALMRQTRTDHTGSQDDPLVITRKQLTAESERLDALETAVHQEIELLLQEL
jgi:TPP-dependent pyruvate/acetoin dehydrogenase alpha subunit